MFVCVSVCILQVYKQMRKLFASRLIIRCLHPEICNISLRHRQRGGAEGRHVGMLACWRVGASGIFSLKVGYRPRLLALPGSILRLVRGMVGGEGVGVGWRAIL